VASAYFGREILPAGVTYADIRGIAQSARASYALAHGLRGNPDARPTAAQIPIDRSIQSNQSRYAWRIVVRVNGANGRTAESLVVVRSGLRLSVAEAEARAVRTLLDNEVAGFNYGGRIAGIGTDFSTEVWIVGVGQFAPS